MPDSSPPKKKRRRIPPIVPVGLAVVALTSCSGLVLGRGAIATSLARGHLEEGGLVCDDRFSVEPNLTFTETTIGPTRCEVRAGEAEGAGVAAPGTGGGATAGAVQAIELLGPAQVETSWFTITRLSVNGIRVELGPDPVAPSMEVALAREIAEAVALPTRLAMAANVAGAFASLRLPSVEVGSAELVRGERSLATLTGVRWTPSGTAESPGPVAISVASADLVTLALPIGMSASASFQDMTGEATADRCRLSGTFHASFTGPLGGVHPWDHAITLVATELNQPAPHYDVRFE